MRRLSTIQRDQVLDQELFLRGKPFNIWDCYSEHESSFNNRLHFHDFYELSIIYEGTSDFMVNGERFSMGEKSLQLVRPADYHRQLTGKNEHIRYYNLLFSDNFLSPELLHEVEKCEKPLCAVADLGQWKQILNLTREIHEVFTKTPENPLTSIFIRCNVENLCLFILKNLNSAGEVRIETMQEPIRRAILFIQNHYRMPIRLRDAAEAAGLSSSYFSALFHHTMGETFSSYLTDYRLKIASRYLRSDDLSVKQVAAVCGFGSYPYFVTAFRERYGMAPGQWREMEED